MDYSPVRPVANFDWKKFLLKSIAKSLVSGIIKIFMLKVILDKIKS